MKDENNIPRADDLDALFNRQPSSGKALDSRDEAFAETVRDLADKNVPVSPQFYSALEQKLLAAAAKRRGRRTPVWVPVLASVVGASALLALVLLSAPMIRRMLGEPQPTSAVQVAVGPAAQRLTPTAAQQATTTPEPVEKQPTPTQSAGWMLATVLPDGPQTVPQYLQVAKGEPLTAQSALAMAERLGVNGSAYQYQGEGGSPVYQILDGIQSVLFFGATNLEFNYSAGGGLPSTGEGKPNLPFEQQAKIAEDWLKAHNLLDFDYRIAPMPTDPTGVMVVQKLEGGELYLENNYDPAINVRISPEGQVTGVIYRPVATESTGRTIAIRPAAEAWAALKNGQTGKNVFYQTLDFTSQRSLKQWFHSYPDGQQVDLYGYAGVIQAVDPGQLPYVEVAGVTLRDNADIIRKITMRKYLHVWGTYHIDAAGHQLLIPQGWELSPLEEANLNGQITRTDGTARIKTETGETYTLVDLPASVPDGVKINVTGALRKPDEVLWYVIQTEIGPDNNQSIGYLPFPTEPSAAEPTPQLPPTGYQPGDKVEGLQGTETKTLFQEADGSITEERWLGLDGWIARLEGPAAVGIEKYAQLPVKVWGTYQVKGADIVIQVDRYEPVFPDVHIESWFGQVSEQTLDGRNVLILTDDSGKQWVLSSTTQGITQSLAMFGWESGQKIIAEGYPSPTGETFGGLPLLKDLGLTLNNKGYTKETYQSMRGNLPANSRQPAQLVLPDTAAVDKVELVYFASDFQSGLPQEEEPRKLQPLWRFSGRLQDGRAFEVLLPAE